MVNTMQGVSMVERNKQGEWFEERNSRIMGVSRKVEKSQTSLERVNQTIEHMTMLVHRMEARLQDVERDHNINVLPNSTPMRFIRERDEDEEDMEFWEREEYHEPYYSHPRGIRNQDNGRERRGVFHGRDNFHHQHHQRRLPRKDDRDLGSTKLKFPNFYGKSNPDEYFQWEKDVEFIFDCNHLYEEKKVRIAISHFKDNAITWWDTFMSNRWRQKLPRIETWDELKKHLRRQFIPKHFNRDNAQWLRLLQQGNKMVENNHKAMKIEKQPPKKPIRYSNVKPFSNDTTSLENVSLIMPIVGEKERKHEKEILCDAKHSNDIHIPLVSKVLHGYMPIVEIESSELEKEILCDVMHAKNTPSSLNNKVSYECNLSTIVPLNQKEAFDIEAKTKVHELLDGKLFESVLPSEQNLSLCEKICEVNSMLFSKPNILKLFHTK